MGKALKEALRVDGDSRIKVEFYGAAITSDGERCSGGAGVTAEHRLAV